MSSNASMGCMALRLFFGALGASWAMPPSTATAEPPSSDAWVRAIFDEGVELVDDRRWAEAEERFRACLAVRQSPVIEYNLASALEAQDELEEAATLFRGILRQPNASAELRGASGARLASLEPRLARETDMTTIAEEREPDADRAPPAPSPQVAAQMAFHPTGEIPARLERPARARPLLWVALSTAVAGVVVTAAFVARDDVGAQAESPPRARVPFEIER